MAAPGSVLLLPGESGAPALATAHMHKATGSLVQVRRPLTPAQINIGQNQINLT